MNSPQRHRVTEKTIWQKGFLCDFVVKRRLLSAHRQPINSKGWRGYRAAKLQVVRNFGDVEEHVFQIASDRDFFHWMGEFAARNPEPRGTARVVARHQVR